MVVNGQLFEPVDFTDFVQALADALPAGMPDDLGGQARYETDSAPIISSDDMILPDGWRCLRQA